MSLNFRSEHAPKTVYTWTSAASRHIFEKPVSLTVFMLRRVTQERDLSSSDAAMQAQPLTLWLTQVIVIGALPDATMSVLISIR